jgi:outer membrane immunogenic protein
MKRLLSLLAALVPLAFLAGGALADGGKLRGLKDSGCVAKFQGFYVGAHGGYTNYTSAQNDLDIFPSSFTASDSGFSGGVQVGYNWQRCNTLFGIEADWSWADLDADTRLFPNDPTVTFTLTSTLKSYGTLRTRAGLVLDHMLLYITGGIAIADIDFVHAVSVPGLSERLSFNETRWGWTAGFGAEWAVSDRMSIKSEVLYLNFGDQDHTAASAVIGQNITYKTDDSVWVSRVGLNWRF